jgi:hypothetical protein
VTEIEPETILAETPKEKKAEEPAAPTKNTDETPKSEGGEN